MSHTQKRSPMIIEVTEAMKKQAKGPNNGYIWEVGYAGTPLENQSDLSSSSSSLSNSGSGLNNSPGACRSNNFW